MRYDILFAGGSFPMPEAGGSVNYVYRLLKEFDRMSYIVYTSSFGKDDNVKFDQEFNHRVIRSKYCRHVLEPFKGGKAKKFYYYIISILEIVFYIIKYKPKLVYFTEISFSVYAYTIARLFCKFKFGLFTYAEEIQQIRNDFGYRWLIPKVLRDADMILTVCDYTHNMLNDIVNVDDKIFKIIPSIPYEGNSKLRSKKETTDQITLLTVSRLSERKGHKDVINALSRLHQEYPNIKYTIVGKGEYEDEIVKCIKKCHAESYVELKGKVSDEDLNKAYDDADIFVMHHKLLSNGDTEGCPTVFLEASWYRLPVVGGEAGGVSDAIKDGETGFICHINTDELYQNIRRLVADSELRLRMGNNAFEYASNFTATKQSRKFLEITKKLIG